LYQWHKSNLDTDSKAGVETIATFATPIITIAAGQNDQLWLGSLFGGLLNYDLKQDKTTAYPISDEKAVPARQSANSIAINKGCCGAAPLTFRGSSAVMCLSFMPPTTS
jgi:hypothetical protein